MTNLLQTRSSLPTGCRWLLVAMVALGAGCPQETQSATVPETTVELAVIIEELSGDYDIRAVQQRKPEMITLGSKFDMSCHIKPGGKPDAEMRWMKDGMPFAPTTEAKLTGWLDRVLYQDYQIRFLNFSLSDAGAYTCITENGTVHANLTVRPVITNVTRMVKSFDGEPANLQCEAIGFPKPTITWTDPRDSQIPTPVNNTLAIRRASPLHNGTYKCVARNSVGETTEIVQLLVMERITFTNVSRQTPVTTVVGGHFALWCKAASRPAPNVTWFFQPHTGGPRRALNMRGEVLRMRSVPAQAAGNYTCVVRSFLPCCDGQDAQPPREKTFQVRLRASGNIVNPVNNPAPDDGTGCTDASCPSGSIKTVGLPTVFLVVSSLLGLLMLV